MKNPSSYLKMRVLGAIDSAPGKTIRDRIKHVAGLIFVDEEENRRQFTWRTIQTWLYRYKVHGVTGIEATQRSDKGKPRKISPEELMEAINTALPHFREKHYTKMDIYRYCIEKGILRKEQLSQTSYFRFVREYDLLSNRDNKKRLAFSKQYANQLWQADTLFGPYVPTGNGNERKQTKLIAFIDDASRVLCHGEFFFEESTDTLIQALRTAFYKRGVPEQLYVDNGPVYKSAEIVLTCSRVGCILIHTAPYDPAAKGKVERFYRRVRDQFLSRQLDLTSLEALNRQFTHWGEESYNAQMHSAIGMKPIDRFGLDLKRIRYLTPMESNDELFYAEAERKVKKDNTFSFQNIRYEAPVDLRSRKITIRYERGVCNHIIVYYKEQRMGEARPLDLIANSNMRREKSPEEKKNREGGKG